MNNGFEREHDFMHELLRTSARTVKPETCDDVDSLEPPDWMDDEPPPEQRRKRNPVPFTMIGDLVAKIEPTDWLVKGFLEDDSLALLFGPPKQGKSFIAIDWALSIATGTPWHGRRTKQCPVFYVAGEGHRGLQRRFIAWGIARGIPLANVPVAVTNRSVPLFDPDGALSAADGLADLADQTGTRPGLIVIDTLARNLGPADENSSRDMSKFIAHLDQIRSTYNASVLIVHHEGKDGGRGARGSTALLGAIDAAYVVKQDASKLVTLTTEAMKDAALPEPISFDLEVVDLGVTDEDGELVTSCAPSPADKTARKQDQLPPQQRRLLTFLWEVLQQHKTIPSTSTRAAPRPPKAGQTAVSGDVLREHVRRSGGLSGSDKPDTEQKALKRAISGLQASGIIEVFDEWVWLADKPDIAGH